MAYDEQDDDACKSQTDHAVSRALMTIHRTGNGRHESRRKGQNDAVRSRMGAKLVIQGEKSMCVREMHAMREHIRTLVQGLGIYRVAPTIPPK